MKQEHYLTCKYNFQQDFYQKKYEFISFAPCYLNNVTQIYLLISLSNMITQSGFILSLFLLSLCLSLRLNGDIKLYPNTQNSPSLYLLPFTLDTALPSQSYLLVAMDWYSAAVKPYNCLLVNSSISIACTNLATPTFPLTITAAQVLKFNPKITTSKTIVILLNSSLLAATAYTLQLHLYNVVPNIQKISSNIQIYSLSSKGLFYEANSNYGPTINSFPNNNLMAVSILNTLSANSPGSVIALKVEITISQAVPTDLSVLMFVMQYPFTFSIGSIPTSTASSLFTTSPISLYSAPQIKYYEVVSPNIFLITFNEKFTAGRKFIMQINQIQNPYIIATANISIYSLPFNSLTPLQAFQMLYPIATTSYELNLELGLPYDAPKLGPMSFYQYLWQYAQVKLTIPYPVPDGYSIRLQLLNAQFRQGTAYANFQSLQYTPTYTYSTYYIIISKMGPMAVGTLITITFQIYISTATLFQLKAYIDKDNVITTYTATKYVYYELAESSGITTSSFFWNFYDSSLWWGQRVKSKSAIVQSEYLRVHIYQNIDPIATSSGSYIDLYFSPNVIISNSFNQNTDCAIYQDTFQPIVTYYTCIVTILRTPNYLKLTVKGNTNYLANVSNIFPFQSTTYINLHNMAFTKSSSNKYIFPVYCSLYKSDVVNPVAYNYARVISAQPPYNTLNGLSLEYISNMYSTTSGTNYQNYPGVLRLQSTTPASLNLVVQPDQQFTIVFHATYGFRSFPLITNGQSYPCTSNIPITCIFYAGTYGNNQPVRYDKVAVTFLDNSYSTKPFHILLPDMQINQYDNYVYAFIGYYYTLKKDWQYISAQNYYRYSGYWIPTEAGAISTMGCDVTGKAGSYRSNVSVTISNNGVQTGGISFLFLSTQWSFFQNGISQLSLSTQLMTSPATFGTNNLSPLGLYMTGGMYLTIIPFTYNTINSNFNIYLDNVHMPYTYDLPTYYIYVIRQSDKQMVSTNQFIMMSGGTLYGSPLQSLSINCQDNSIGVANTYCTIAFGTSNPLLASGNVRVQFSGMSIATNKCYLKSSIGVLIPTTCTSSSDNKNVTITLSGTGFYTAGNFSLVVYGVGITKNTLSQSITLYLYDDSIQYVIESGVRIMTTTIAALDYISLTQIIYSYLNPLSYNTMEIQFYLPRVLYEDEEFAFVIGQDLSDVNTENARLKIVIKGQNFTLYPLFIIDNVNYLIIFSFTDPSKLIVGSYIMIIYGICTPASQSNGAFNMIYRRTYDFTYTLVNSANVIFPVFNSLVTSNISISTLFNTEGYKQQIDITIVNTDLNVNSQMIWIINFPSYFSPQLFQQDAYCMIDSAVIPCVADPSTPYQIIIKNSPKTVHAGSPYIVSLVGIACPRLLYANNIYPSRFIFVGVLQNSVSTAYAQRSLILPYQTIQSTIPGLINVIDMVGVSVSSLYSFSSIYAQFKLYSNVAISSGSYLYLDLPVQFDNLNNIQLNSILIYGISLISSTAKVINRRIQILVSITIPLKTEFRVDFPNLPTPKNPCNVLMSDMIVTVTPANKLSILSASTQQSNSAPLLTFVRNTKYISFNNDQSIMITAGTYSTPISITTNDHTPFLSNINVILSSNGFTFNPSRIFLPIGMLSQNFVIGADTDLLPIVYFYQGAKQQEVNTNYQITLNMNIQVTNNPISINFPSSLTLPIGGCTDPFLISLANAPFKDLQISYTYDNQLYSQNDFFPNPLTTLSQLSFNSTVTNGTISFCSSSSFSATQVAVNFHLSGTNYRSYTILPSATVLINVVNSVPNTAPVVSLTLKNQQKTYLDINFTNNANGMIFYHLQTGKNKSPLSILQIQVYLKSNKWSLESQSEFMTRVYTADRDNRVGSFYQTASITPVRLDNLIPETYYTLCAYLVNSFGATSTPACLQVSTMTWGSIIKASLRFTHALTAQQLNNVICFFTLASGTSKYYLIDMEGNSCGDRAVSNPYYKYMGSSSITQTRGTNIYLLTNPNLVGTDPAPLAFTNLFSSLGSLSSTTLSAAQSSFSITYMTGTIINSYDISNFKSINLVSPLIVYFSQPIYSSMLSTLTISNIRLVGAEGTIYFILVLYKQIFTQIDGSVQMNIRLNYPPTAEQILNCQDYQGNPTQGCARAVYTGISPLSITFSGIQTNSVYNLYYFPSSQFPLRPIVSDQIYSQAVITYLSDPQIISYMCIYLILLVLLWG